MVSKKKDISYIILLLIAFSAPFSSLSIGGLKIIYPLTVLVFISFLFPNKDRNIIPTKISIISVILLFSTIYAWLFANYEKPVIFLGIFGSILLSLVSFKLLSSKEKIERFLFFFHLGFGISNIIILVFLFFLTQYKELILNDDRFGARISGFYDSANNFSSALILIIPISTYFFLNSKGFFRFINLFFVINGLVLLVFAQSRFAIFGFLASIILVFFLKRKTLISFYKKRLVKFYLFMFLFLVSITFAVVNNTIIYNSFEKTSGIKLSRFNPNSVRTINQISYQNMKEERFYIIQSSLITIASYPFGIGYTDHEKVVGKITGIYKSSHNFLLTEILNYGILLGTLWCVIWLIPVFLGFRKIINSETWDIIDFVYIGYVAFILYGFGHYAINWVYFWLYYIILIKLTVFKNLISREPLLRVKE